MPHHATSLSCHGGAPVRSAARSRAERARGFAETSDPSGLSARRVSSLKVGSGQFRGSVRLVAIGLPLPAPLAEEALHGPVLKRVEGHDDGAPPRPQKPLDLLKPRSISPISSLTRMRSAWKVRVAGSILP